MTLVTYIELKIKILMYLFDLLYFSQIKYEYIKIGKS